MTTAQARPGAMPRQATGHRANAAERAAAATPTAADSDAPRVVSSLFPLRCATPPGATPGRLDIESVPRSNDPTVMT